MPSINYARYTQRIIQTVKSRLSEKSIVSEKSPPFRPARKSACSLLEMYESDVSRYQHSLVVVPVSRFALVAGLRV